MSTATAEIERTDQAEFPEASEPECGSPPPPEAIEPDEDDDGDDLPQGLYVDRSVRLQQIGERLYGIIEALGSTGYLFRPYIDSADQDSLEPLMPGCHAVTVKALIDSARNELIRFSEEFSQECEAVAESAELGNRLFKELAIISNPVDRLEARGPEEVAAVVKMMTFYLNLRRDERRQFDKVVAQWAAGNRPAGSE